VGNGVLRSAKEEINILHTINGRKDSWICHIWRSNCLLEHLLDGEGRGKNKRGEDEEEDVNSYCITLKKGKNTAN
jgi:hypothetical protein